MAANAVLIWSDWSWEPSVILGCLLLAGLYLGAAGPWRRRLQRAAALAEAPLAARQMAWVMGGLLVVLLALISPLDEIGDTYLFSAHMVQHMLLVLAAAPMLLLGTPGWMLAPLLRKAMAAERLVTMVLAKVKGAPFESEMVPTAFAPVPMPPAVQDLAKAKLMLITDGGLVPKGNPDKIQGSAATRWGSYNIEHCDDLRGDDYEISHGGYDPQFVCQDPDRLVPLDALRELEKAGVIGKLHDEFLATSGLANPLSNTRRMGREMAAKAKLEGIDAVILTST